MNREYVELNQNKGSNIDNYIPYSMLLLTIIVNLLL